MNIFQKDGLILFDKSPHSPHSIIVNLISPNTTVLDIGCNSGLLGKALQNRNIFIDGIDINKRMLKLAKPYYRYLFNRNLYNPKLNIPKNKYNFIILSDILEHLPRPDLILADIKKYLQPHGKVIISIPNIARFENRINLLFGKFDYHPGIMSPDHLRFFTYQSAKEMIEKSGYHIVKVIPTGLGHKLGMFSRLTAFQFIFVIIRQCFSKAKKY